MQSTTGDRKREGLQRLQTLVGAWTEEVDVAGGPVGRMEFDWALGGEILLQRSDTPVEGFPDSFSVITTDAKGGHLQHYFDSRGVVRLYRMEIDDQSWTLQRDTADFTPLQFAQRFRARIINDRLITGAWERSDDGAHWQQDFTVTYRRIT